MSKVWASRMHLHRTDPEGLVGILSLDDVDHLLTQTALRAPAIRIAQNGSVLPESRYLRRATLAGQPLTGLIDPRKVFDLYDAGATIVLQGMHRYWEPLTLLIADLEIELGHPCQANAYLTPPGSQGFAVHSDTHDVFVFQTHGTKMWEIHETGEQGPGEGPRDVLLEPGLSMYLPTGTPHAARAQDGASLHVTIGINQLTWRGLLRRTVEQLVATVPDTHLPAGYLEAPTDLSAHLAGHLAALADQVRALQPEALVEREIERFLTTRPARLRGGLADVLAVRDLDDATGLARRGGHPCVLLDSGDRVKVLLGDRTVEMPGWLRPALEQIRVSDKFRPADLTDLDARSRLVLCRRLVREGLLRVIS